MCLICRQKDDLSLPTLLRLPFEGQPSAGGLLQPSAISQIRLQLLDTDGSQQRENASCVHVVVATLGILDFRTISVTAPSMFWVTLAISHKGLACNSERSCWRCDRWTLRWSAICLTASMYSLGVLAIHAFLLRECRILATPRPENRSPNKVTTGTPIHSDSKAR